MLAAVLRMADQQIIYTTTINGQRFLCLCVYYMTPEQEQLHTVQTRIWNQRVSGMALHYPYV